MVPVGFFTRPDLHVISRAASLAERLTGRYFSLGPNDWRKHPYSLFTRKEVDLTLHEENAFASVIRYRSGKRGMSPSDFKYGIVLQDPNILLALLRSPIHDLWSLGLFVLTHELVHIMRFRLFEIDFCADDRSRDREEHTVQNITKEILSGVTNTDYLISLYDKH